MPHSKIASSGQITSGREINQSKSSYEGDKDVLNNRVELRGNTSHSNATSNKSFHPTSIDFNKQLDAVQSMIAVVMDRVDKQNQ